MLKPEVLGQLLLMQSYVISLPDEKSIFSFVCRGLMDIPGVSEVSYSGFTQKHSDESIVRLPILLGTTDHGELLFKIREPEAFKPYEDYLNNFCYMLAVILEERNQRHLNELFKSELEMRVQQRTLELHNLSARQEAILAAVPDIIMEADNNRIYTWANSAGTEFFGEDVIGKEYMYYFEPDQRTSEIVQPLYDGTERLLYVESWQRRKDGEIRLLAWWCKALFDEQGTVTGTLSTARDITDNRMAENGLRESEERFRTLVNTIPDLIWLKDANGVYMSCNRMFERFIGAKEEAIVGKTDYDFVSKDLADSFRDSDLKTMTMGKPDSSEEWITFPDNGQRALLYRTKTPMYDTNGTFIGVLGVGRDISEIKKNEEERLKLEYQLQQAQKMESVGRLAGGVAHDFNNMLSVILGHVSLLLMETTPSHPLYGNLEEIRKAAERSADLTQQLLAFARKQTINPKEISLNESISGMLKMLQRLIGEDIQLKWLPSDDLWLVKVDPSQIDQILANLCVNARDSISDIGKITIETGNSLIDENYAANNVESVPGEYVTLTVSDNGCGMNKETMAHIFEPFFTTKAVGEGTGLGLSTVFGAVKQNNGFINVYSEPDLGTKFTIYLPRYKGHTGQTPTERELKTTPRGQETILLVEDEPAILNMASIILRKQGYTVLAANSPSQAIELAKEHPSELHLIMTDVVMPEMNGRDLAKKLQSLHPKLKCLYMSGYTANVIAHHGVLDSGVSFIQKPFNIITLADKLREVLDS